MRRKNVKLIEPLNSDDTLAVTIAGGFCKIISTHSACALEELKEVNCFLKRLEQEVAKYEHMKREYSRISRTKMNIFFIGATVSGYPNTRTEKSKCRRCPRTVRKCQPVSAEKCGFRTRVSACPEKCTRKERYGGPMFVFEAEEPSKKQLYYI